LHSAYNVLTYSSLIKSFSYLTELIIHTGGFIFYHVKTEALHIAILLHLVAMAARGWSRYHHYGLRLTKCAHMVGFRPAWHEICTKIAHFNHMLFYFDVKYIDFTSIDGCTEIAHYVNVASLIDFSILTFT
jgi:hypothetical protein